MKKLSYFLMSALVGFMLTSCGGTSKKEALSPKDFYTSVDSSVEAARISYYDFVSVAEEFAVPEDRKISNDFFSFMEKLLDEEKKKLSELQNPDTEDAKKLKESAIKYLDILNDGQKKELLEIKNIINNNESITSDHINEIREKSMKFDDRSTEVFDVYLDIRDAYSAKNKL